MVEFRVVSPSFAVAGQFSREDFARAAAAGYRTIINNRPDAEAPDIDDAEARKAAAEAGLAYFSLPFGGPPPPAIVAETADLLAQAQGPVLAYCRTGTRSIMAWAMAQALAGELTPDKIVSVTAKAGYDVSGARVAFEQLAPRS